MKSNSSKFLTPSDFNKRTVLAKFVRWISGIVLENISLRYAISVYNR